MADAQGEVEKKTAGTANAPLGARALKFWQRAWRPAGTAVAVGLALLVMTHVVNGKNGLTVWHQKRAEDKQLQQEIMQLEQENAALRAYVERLKSDPDAIEHEAREKLHYAKPNEVIVALPPQQQDQAQPAG
ncbi:MAG: septum formation initiator family protein, partial [Terracidiphilus sp.]|nr:septum formation initiator family protein [Terracidiphilus sp.]